MATTDNKASRQRRLRLVLEGIDKHFRDLNSFKLGGASIASGDLKGLIQSDIDASDATVQTRAKLREDVKVERDVHAKVNPVLRSFKFFVIAQFGETANASTTLADFGFSPRKSTKKTVATKTVATEKTKATRTLRHTMGPKQKAKVKGTVPAPSASPGTPPKPTAS